MIANQDAPFQFLWAVDQDGYEMHEERVEPYDERATELPDHLYRVIRRKGGPWREYRPDPGIARQFASLPETEEAVLGFVNTYGLIGTGRTHDPITGDPENWPDEGPLWLIYESIRTLRALYSYIDSDQRQIALEQFNDQLTPHMTIKLGGGGPKKPNLQVVPLELNSFMHLQLVNEITGRAGYTRCEQCPKWFPYRPKKQFCSDRCRKAWHRHHK